MVTWDRITKTLRCPINVLAWCASLLLRSTAESSTIQNWTLVTENILTICLDRRSSVSNWTCSISRLKKAAAQRRAELQNLEVLHDFRDFILLHNCMQYLVGKWANSLVRDCPACLSACVIYFLGVVLSTTKYVALASSGVQFLAEGESACHTLILFSAISIIIIWIC